MVPMALLLLGASASVQVAPIVRIVAPDASAPTRADVERAANEAIAWMLDAAPVPRDASSVRLDDDVRRCGVDNVCVARRMAAAGIAQVVYVVVNLAVDPALVSVEVIDTASRRALAQRLAEVEDDPVAVVAATIERALLEAGHRLGGRLTVEVHPSDAALELTPTAPVAADAATVLAPGRYVLTARRDGFQSATTALAIAAKAHTRSTLTLTEDDAILSTWWFWTAVGAVAVAGATTAVLLAQPGTIDVCHELGAAGC